VRRTQVKPRLGAADVLTMMRFPLAAVFPFAARPLAWATGAVSVYAIWDYGRAVRRGDTGSGSHEPTPEA
jgi:hypothetical protein